jgi:hypothetical protein
MRRSILLFCLFLLSGVGVYSQPGRNPQPTPVTGLSDTLERNVERSNDLNRRSENLRMTENFPVKNDEERKAFRENVMPRYRETTDDEKKFLAPNSEDAAAFAKFLDQKNTGLTRLVASRGCADDPRVVNTSPQCEGRTMPGAGSAFSFRFGDYRILDLSDLNFKNNRFESLGVLNHGFIVNLGDTPLEEVTLGSNGVEYLDKLKPAKDFNKAAEIAQNLTKGIKDGDFTYASVLPAEVNKTYVLRVIAYQGEAPKEQGGFAYNEMELDKREDIIVAFRVVRLNPNEDVTILWKKLSDKKSPKLKPKK